MGNVWQFWRRHTVFLFILAGSVAFALAYLALAGNGWGTYRRLSQSFLAGRLDIPAEQIDALHLRDLSLFQGRFYYPMGVLPALVMLPGVAAVGLDFPQGALVLALAIAIGALTYSLTRRLGYGERDALWVVVALTMCSPFTYLVLRATVFDTYLTHLLALACLLAALAECLGRRRWWLLGALLGLSTMARPLTVMAALFFFVLGVLAAIRGSHDARREKVQRLIALVVPLTIAVALVAAYNASRFGNPFESGYIHQLIDPATVAARGIGLFSWQHFPGNFYRAVLAGPVPVFAAGSPILLRFPYLTFDGRGMSWLLSFPLLWLFFRVACRRPLVKLSAVTAGAIALPLLLSFAHGEHQYGYRFAFDFLPFLLLALLAGLPGRLGRMGKTLIVIGGLGNAWLTLPVLLHLHVVTG